MPNARISSRNPFRRGRFEAVESRLMLSADFGAVTFNQVATSSVAVVSTDFTVTDLGLPGSQLQEAYDNFTLSILETPSRFRGSGELEVTSELLKSYGLPDVTGQEGDLFSNLRVAVGYPPISTPADTPGVVRAYDYDLVGGNDLVPIRAVEYGGSGLLSTDQLSVGSRALFELSDPVLLSSVSGTTNQRSAGVVETISLGGDRFSGQPFYELGFSSLVGAPSGDNWQLLSPGLSTGDLQSFPPPTRIQALEVETSETGIVATVEPASNPAASSSVAESQDAAPIVGFVGGVSVEASRPASRTAVLTSQTVAAVSPTPWWLQASHAVRSESAVESVLVSTDSSARDGWERPWAFELAAFTPRDGADAELVAEEYHREAPPNSARFTPTAYSWSPVTRHVGEPLIAAIESDSVSRGEAFADFPGAETPGGVAIAAQPTGSNAWAAVSAAIALVATERVWSGVRKRGEVRPKVVKRGYRRIR